MLCSILGFHRADPGCRGGPLRHRLGRAVIAAVVLPAAVALRAQTILPIDDLTELSLEELGALSISAAAKRTQPLFVTPAAVSVLLSEEIRRSGHATAAEALRLVPGVHVARSNAAKWSIGMRGFNGLSSSKLLVLVDGRTIYSPYYGGVDWAEADVPLSDVERIEVVRGPGATLWGANAVNGIINIISKSARDTQGTLLAVRAGTGDGISADMRHGGEIGRRAWYRFYLRNSRNDYSERTRSLDEAVDFEQWRTGFRVDGEWSESVAFTWQTDFVHLRNLRFVREPVSGAHLAAPNTHRRVSVLGRVVKQQFWDGELTVQVYADRASDSADKTAYLGLGLGSFGVAENGSNVDLDVTHHRTFGERHRVVWGGGARRTRIDLELDGAIVVQQPQTTQHLFNFFVQDEIALVRDRLHLTLGSKFERHDTVGWQVQPSVRASFTPSSRQTWWAAVSRAVRSPSHSERDIRLPFAAFPATPFTPPMQIDLVGTSAFHEEVMDAYEIGWRFKPAARFTYEFTAYLHDYDKLRDLTPITRLQLAPLLLLTEMTAVNEGKAKGYGAEANFSWRVSERWSLAGFYALQQLDPQHAVEPRISGPDYSLPRDMWSLRSTVALPRDAEFTIATYYTGAVADFGVPRTLRTDLLLTLRPRPELEIMLGVQNAFDPRHPEYGATSVYPIAEVRRNLFGRVQWRF